MRYKPFKLPHPYNPEPNSDAQPFRTFRKRRLTRCFQPESLFEWHALFVLPQRNKPKALLPDKLQKLHRHRPVKSTFKLVHAGNSEHNPFFDLPTLKAKATSVIYSNPDSPSCCTLQRNNPRLHHSVLAPGHHHHHRNNNKLDWSLLSLSLFIYLQVF